MGPNGGISKEGITPDLFLFPWIFTLFSQGVNYHSIWHIWDRLFTGWTTVDNRDNLDMQRTISTSINHCNTNGACNVWKSGINPCYLVSLCVAIVCALRQPLLASKEFSTAVDLLQSGLTILNGTTTGKQRSQKRYDSEHKHSSLPSLECTDFFLLQFTINATMIYKDHAMPHLTGKKTSLVTVFCD